MRKCAKSWESVKKCAKSEESTIKCAKTCESVPKLIAIYLLCFFCIAQNSDDIF